MTDTKFNRGLANAKSALQVPGKLADLVILSVNPLTVAPGAINDIKMRDRINEGKSVYRVKQ